MCRYEILLPLQFNDGSPVPGELVWEVIATLRKRFGAVSHEMQTIRGYWMHEGAEFRDQLARLFIDVADTAENREFVRALKEQLKSRFSQLDVWITRHPVEVI